MKVHGKKYPLQWEEILYQHKQNVILLELALLNRPYVYEKSKKRKELSVSAIQPSIAKFSMRKWKIMNWKFKFDTEISYSLQ